MVSSNYFIILIGLTWLIQITISEKCLEYLSPIYRYKIKVVDCPIVSSNNKRQTIPTDNMLTINFNCLIDDNILCNKVENVLVTAGKFITATLNLKSAVNLDAQFVNFCSTYGDCGNQKVILGATRPGRMIPLVDTDGKIRFYPQALLKQMDLPAEHPQLGPNDIVTIFNSDVTYWFEGDPSSTLSNSPDMLYVVVHELIHGLGFTTAWTDYFNIQVLTPIIGQLAAEGQFFEFIFDKYLVLLPSGKTFTSIADELNKFPINVDMTKNDFINAFSKSPQFLIAQDAYNNAITHGTIGFLTKPNLPPNTPLTQDDVVILETSLVPFTRGSSIAHVDFQTYFSTSDFLMMYRYPKISLGEMMFRAGSANTTGPIGPKLRLLLEMLGYEVKKDYIPPVILSSLKSDNNPFNDTSNTSKSPNSSNTTNKKNDSSLITFNLALSLVCILLTLPIAFIKNVRY
ncbi:hypothetical protein C1645_877852 [Glomus cerebriforme]|uniref:Sequence orphan n=1 Tax=Glomus cerebriforme TaxID=658196 RepID=A0A397SUY9_9GLOM|nr:hypothetical protein C1645_877852 [Glomus cerebriforme]